ncbi:Pancreatic triacylglycerol lipase, partial [Pseudolycoriella hygida]
SEVLFVYASDNVLKYSELEQEQGVKYLAYARNNLQISVDIRDVSFNDNEPTVFIVHGFESKNLDQPSQLKDDLFRLWLEVERVIIVSWKEYSYGSESTAFQASSDYVNVVQYHVPRLARDIFEKIVHIRKNGANGPIAIIGHGVGAHVAGQTGKLLKKETGYTLDKIIGLDPAVYYFKEHSNSSLQNEDSKNTVRIHTKAYGYGNLSGPNDVKVNGGERQANGEQNSGEEPETVLPDLLKNCISVHSIAVGSATSPKLEQISTDTNGLVAYASEDGTSKDLRRTGKRDMIRPKPVSDLRALLDNANERMISLGWTSPSNDFFDMEIKGYDI